MDSIDKELLPCPMCGGEAICDISVSPTGSKLFHVFCQDHTFHEVECFSADNMQKAIDRWNTRTPPADTVCISRAELEGMKKHNEWIPTSKREKDMANYAHNALIDKLLER